MLSFLASSTFFKYAQNEFFAFKNFKIFMGGGEMPPNPPSMFGALRGPYQWYQIFKSRGPDGYCL
jgi:hypothetical protein